MAAEKNLATRLMDVVEDLYIENLALKSLFKTFANRLPPQSQIDSLIEEAKKHPLVGGRIREQFQPVRNRLREEANLEKALQEFLRVVPPSKEVN